MMDTLRRLAPDLSPQAPLRPAAGADRVGVLLVNLGSPEAASHRAVRRFLKEFLSDRRVIEINPLLWRILLHGVILPWRPFASARAYRHIWNRERDEAPLRAITRSQSERLAAACSAQPRLVIDWAMRYGSPSIGSRIEALAAQGCERILLFPLYPQYSATTTASACDCAFDALKRLRRQPALRVVPPYHDDPDYIAALADALRSSLATLDFEPDAVLASFHGLPQSYADKGDPYRRHCEETARLLREALNWDENRLLLTFQSRMGRGAWLRPYTDATLRRLAREGVRRVAVVTPGFAADCLETLEEIAVRAAASFREEGGETFAAIPCLNDSPRAIDLLASLARRELQGWL